MKRYTIEVSIPDANEDPMKLEPTQRLKQWLKLGLRGFKIKAEGISEGGKESVSGFAPVPCEGKGASGVRQDPKRS